MTTVNGLSKVELRDATGLALAMVAGGVVRRGSALAMVAGVRERTMAPTKCSGG